MPTPAERRALIYLSAVSLIGAGYRSLAGAAPPPLPGSKEGLSAQIAAVEAARQGRVGRLPPETRTAGSRRADSTVTDPRTSDRPRRRTVIRVTTPVPAGPIDVDRASASQLEALPGIGPALAARIVSDRDSLGDFGSLREFQRVRGIGPAMARKLAPHVTFSGSARPSNAPSDEDARRRRTHRNRPP